MAHIFPRWSNWLPLKALVILPVVLVVLVGGVSYFFTPKYTRVGYMPTQPVAFDHALHVNQIGMDCRFCHTGVEVSSHSNIPNTQTCMGCHEQIQPTSPKLAPVRESWKTGLPVRWVKVHKAPDYVYFNHAVHVNRGVGCQSCHGTVNQMPTLVHDQPQSMAWCLDCHREPEKNLRPQSEIYNTNWTAESPQVQMEEGRRMVADCNIRPPQTCSGCHR